MEKTEINAVVAGLGLTVKTEFVPFSRSRNAGKTKTSERSLNWRVTLVRNGKDVLTTDYSAGIGHCPSYNQAARWNLEYTSWIEFETETGHKARQLGWGITKGAAIALDPLDVLYSLVSDADVLNYSSFEDWAGNFGYDPDSRSAEVVYRACLELALKLRNAIGETGLEALNNAFQDY